MKSPLGLEARIPVFELFKDALFLLWAKRGRLVSMFLPIIIVLVVLDHFSSEIVSSLAASAGVDEQLEVVEFPLEFWFMTAVSIVLSILLATTVHRFTLMDASHWPSNALRIPRAYDWRYLWRFIQIIFIAIAVPIITITVVTLLLGTQVSPGMSGSSGASNLIFIIILMFIPYILARLSVTLPEIATGVKGSDLGRAWRMSRGTGGRLIIVVLILPFIVTIPFTVFATLDNVLARVVAAFGAYSMTLISITVLSLSYQFLLEFYEPDEGEEVTPEKDDDDGMDA